MKVREEASNFLWSAGTAAEPALQKGIKSSDAEVAWRAREILSNLKYGIRPDTPEEVRQLIKQYRDGDNEVRQNIFIKLLETGDKASGALLAIIISERNEALRRNLLNQMGMRVNEIISDLIIQGNWADAEKILESVLDGANDPTSRNDALFCMLVVDLAPKLEKRDRKKEADKIFSKAFDFYQTICADHPQLASCHNNLAWMAVVCQREMEQALTHAQKAVETVPNNPAFLDTLAEIRFQRKEIKEAVELMKKCVQLAPKAGYFRKQLKRFESGDLAAKRPDEDEAFWEGK